MTSKNEMDLEKFIRENRTDFDCRIPSTDLWEKIELALPEATPLELRHRNPGKIFRMAASILFLIGFGYLLGRYWQSDKLEGEIARLSPTYGNEVAEYTSFISAKREELKILTSENPDLFEAFDAELTSLEVEYKSLKNNLPKNPNQEKLLTAMVQNLQWQLDILNKQVEISRKINNKTDEKAAEMV